MFNLIVTSKHRSICFRKHKRMDCRRNMESRNPERSSCHFRLMRANGSFISRRGTRPAREPVKEHLDQPAIHDR